MCLTETYPEPSQTSEILLKAVTYFHKNYILYTSLNSEYALALPTQLFTIVFFTFPKINAGQTIWEKVKKLIILTHNFLSSPITGELSLKS